MTLHASICTESKLARVKGGREAGPCVLCIESFITFYDYWHQCNRSVVNVSVDGWLLECLWPTLVACVIMYRPLPVLGNLPSISSASSNCGVLKKWVCQSWKLLWRYYPLWSLTVNPPLLKQTTSPSLLLLMSLKIWWTWMSLCDDCYLICAISIKFYCYYSCILNSKCFRTTCVSDFIGEISIDWFVERIDFCFSTAVIMALCKDILRSDMQNNSFWYLVPLFPFLLILTSVNISNRTVSCWKLRIKR